MYISCIASRETDLAKDQLVKCQLSWVNTLHTNDIFNFIFGKSINEEFIKDKNNFKNIDSKIIDNEIHYDVQDIYDLNDKTKFNATYKTLLNIRDFLKTNHTHYVRTHTGSYLHLKLLSNYVSTLPSYNLYAGVKGVAFQGQEKTIFCSGACFIISRDVAEKIWNNHQEILSLYEQRIHRQNSVDDVFFGSIIYHKFKIGITELPRVEVRSKNINISNNNFHYLMCYKHQSISEDWYGVIHKQFMDLHV